MTFELNLDGVEPWKGGGVILRGGVHHIRCVEEEIRRPGDEGYDKPYNSVLLQLLAVAGEEKGCEIRDWVNVIPPGPDTKGTLGRVAGIYKAFGVEIPSGTFKWLPVKGRECKVTVREEPRRDGKTDAYGEPLRVSVVKGYSELSDVDRITGAFDATEVSTDEPDIPF